MSASILMLAAGVLEKEFGKFMKYLLVIIPIFTLIKMLFFSISINAPQVWIWIVIITLFIFLTFFIHPSLKNMLLWRSKNQNPNIKNHATKKTEATPDSDVPYCRSLIQKQPIYKIVNKELKLLNE
jgi:hypothetical protein